MRLVYKTEDCPATQVDELQTQKASKAAGPQEHLLYDSTSVVFYKRFEKVDDLFPSIRRGGKNLTRKGRGNFR